MLCAIVFPPCPHDADGERMCQSFCLETTDTCPALSELIDCEDLPVGEDDFCAVVEGDIFETGFCGTRPAFDPHIRIVGGGEAPPGSWLWIGSLERFADHFCGCTLLNKEWAVTAAHCVESGSTFGLTARFGVLKQSENLPYEQERNVTRVIIHPAYTYFDDRNDIALLQLESPVEFSDYVRPACVATDLNELSTYTNCMAAGWGRTLEGDYYYYGPDGLQQVSVPLISSEHCRSADFNYGSRITDEMICAGIVGNDTCQGDSGGPLVCEDGNGLWHLVGITSWGYGCAVDRQPGVYARVAWLQYFIQDTITGGTGLCRPDQFQCADGTCTPSCWDQCDFVTQCADGSDELDCDYCGIEPIITLPDNGMVFNLTSKNYPSNYITSYERDLICQWFVSTSSGPGEFQGFEVVTGSSIYIHFVDFSIDTYGAYLYFGRDEANWREVALTGSSLPLDMISPNGTDMIVITFEVRSYAYPQRGFYMQLSEYTN
ncbi:chymotrypsinogen B-like [Amphiura filiformis]|uniref:chymotrypsinogen B-like n=1 Tax=Amphiura filiformis TaxID=82378 RepID=UPI003B21D962